MVALNEPSPFERLANRGANTMNIVEGLGEIVEGTASHTPHGALDAGLPGHHDDLHSRAFALQSIEQIESVGASESHVDDHDIEIRIVQDRCGDLRRLRELDTVPVPGQNAPQGAQEQRLVVDQ